MANLFGTTPKSFTEKLSGIKSMFKSAYDNATALGAEMQVDIDSKNSQIEVLNSEIDTIKITQEENTTFLNNLEKFI